MPREYRSGNRYMFLSALNANMLTVSIKEVQKPI